MENRSLSINHLKVIFSFINCLFDFYNTVSLVYWQQGLTFANKLEEMTQ